jgi:hypothetical protein
MALGWQKLATMIAGFTIPNLHQASEMCVSRSPQDLTPQPAA